MTKGSTGFVSKAMFVLNLVHCPSTPSFAVSITVTFWELVVGKCFQDLCVLGRTSYCTHPTIWISYTCVKKSAGEDVSEGFL